MKLKVDDEGKVEVRNGMPVYVDGAGKEVEFDAPKAVSKIKEQAEELAETKSLLDKSAKEVRSWERLGTKEELREAKATVAGLEESDLDTKELPAEVEKLKAENEALKAELGESKEAVTAADARIWDLQIGNKFGSSPWIRENLIEAFADNPDALRRLYGENFKLEDGRMVATGPDGKPIYVVDAETNEAKLADFDQALEVLVGDAFRKPSGAKGSEAENNNGQITDVSSAPKHKGDFSNTGSKVDWIKANGREAFEKLPAKPNPNALASIST